MSAGISESNSSQLRVRGCVMPSTFA
jgi:hypothetical protein